MKNLLEQIWAKGCSKNHNCLDLLSSETNKMKNWLAWANKQCILLKASILLSCWLCLLGGTEKVKMTKEINHSIIIANWASPFLSYPCASRGLACFAIQSIFQWWIRIWLSYLHWDWSAMKNMEWLKCPQLCWMFPAFWVLTFNNHVQGLPWIYARVVWGEGGRGTDHTSVSVGPKQICSLHLVSRT